MAPAIDIVMGVHATREYPAEPYFEKCYADLCRTVSDFRLILVADACDEQGWSVVERIAKDRKTTLVIRTNYQRWYSRAYNIGMRQVRTPRVVVLNADTELSDGWLEELTTCWSEAEVQGGRVGMVGSVLSEPEPRRWAFAPKPDYVTAHAVLMSMQGIFEVSAARGMPGWYYDETKQLNIHIRSDVDLSWGLNALGYSTVKSFKSAVGHHGGKSWGYNLARVQCLRLEEVND